MAQKPWCDCQGSILSFFLPLLQSSLISHLKIQQIKTFYADKTFKALTSDWKLFKLLQALVSVIDLRQGFDFILGVGITCRRNLFQFRLVFPLAVADSWEGDGDQGLLVLLFLKKFSISGVGNGTRFYSEHSVSGDKRCSCYKVGMETNQKQHFLNEIFLQFFSSKGAGFISYKEVWVPLVPSTVNFFTQEATWEKSLVQFSLRGGFDCQRAGVSFTSRIRNQLTTSAFIVGW